MDAHGTCCGWTRQGSKVGKGCRTRDTSWGGCHFFTRFYLRMSQAGTSSDEPSTVVVTVSCLLWVSVGVAWDKWKEGMTVLFPLHNSRGRHPHLIYITEVVFSFPTSSCDREEMCFPCTCRDHLFDFHDIFPHSSIPRTLVKIYFYLLIFRERKEGERKRDIGPPCFPFTCSGALRTGILRGG